MAGGDLLGDVQRGRRLASGFLEGRPRWRPVGRRCRTGTSPDWWGSLLGGPAVLLHLGKLSVLGFLLVMMMMGASGRSSAPGATPPSIGIASSSGAVTSASISAFSEVRLTSAVAEGETGAKGSSVVRSAPGSTPMSRETGAVLGTCVAAAVSWAIARASRRAYLPKPGSGTDIGSSTTALSCPGGGERAVGPV